MLTPQELELLKSEIKTEILREIKTQRTSSPWNKIRASVSQRLKGLSVSEQYQVLTAISTIIRYSLGIKRTQDLLEEQAETATEIANRVVDMIMGAKQTESEGSPPCGDA